MKKLVFILALMAVILTACAPRTILVPVIVTPTADLGALYRAQYVRDLKACNEALDNLNYKLQQTFDNGQLFLSAAWQADAKELTYRMDSTCGSMGSGDPPAEYKEFNHVLLEAAFQHEAAMIDLRDGLENLDPAGIRKSQAHMEYATELLTKAADLLP